MGMAVGIGMVLNNNVGLQNFTGISDTGAPPESSGAPIINYNILNSDNLG